MAEPICFRCRHAPCRCTANAPLDDEARELVNLARAVRVRQEAMALSPAYVVWLDSGKIGPEPLVPANVRRQILELMDELERIGQ